jgi:hypothetical protein
MPIALHTWQNGDVAPIMPYDPAPSSFEIRHRRTVLVSDARSGRRVTRRVGGERIEVSLKFPPMQRGDYEPLLTFLRYVGDRNTIMAVRFPILTDGPSGYGETGLHLGEYYNINHASNNNQLVQLVSTGPTVVRPEDRQGNAPVLQPWSVRQPHLKCSLDSDVVIVDYGADDIIRLEVDLVERW